MILKSIIQQGSGTSKSSLERLILGVAPKVVRKPPRISSLCTRLCEPSEYLSYSVGTAAQLELYFFPFPKHLLYLNWKDHRSCSSCFDSTHDFCFLSFDFHFIVQSKAATSVPKTRTSKPLSTQQPRTDVPGMSIIAMSSCIYLCIYTLYTWKKFNNDGKTKKNSLAV